MQLYCTGLYWVKSKLTIPVLIPHGLLSKPSQNGLQEKAWGYQGERTGGEVQALGLNPKGEKVSVYDKLFFFLFARTFIFVILKKKPTGRDLASSSDIAFLTTLSFYV